MKDKGEITMLGTGAATVTRCYNTCFLLKCGEDVLLADAGGGNGILSRLELAGTPVCRLHDMFLTHSHSDHVLGAVWIVRMVIQCAAAGNYRGVMTVYGHEKVLRVLKEICRLVLSEQMMRLVDEYVVFRVVCDCEEVNVGRIRLTFFDLLSTKEKQFGFSALMPDGQRVVFFGDEPCHKGNGKYACRADWMICEAFCLHSDCDVFRPYEKCHGTALDSGRLAEEFGVKNLLLCHTEDRTLDTRKRLYTLEAKSVFSGNVFVPDDMETVHLR